MNQIKIGQFIAERRKAHHLTQAQLAEQLGISDRAVSKWENAKSMPDSSIMLELCEILEITVTELLKGEFVEMKNYEAVTQETLLDMKRTQEKSNRTLLKLEYVLLATAMIGFSGLALASRLTDLPWARILLIVVGFAILIPSTIICMTLEYKVGYYQCPHCKHTYVPTFRAFHLSMHMGRTHYMTCPHCHKKGWQKKVLINENDDQC